MLQIVGKRRKMPSRSKKVRFETEYNSSFKAFNPDVYKSPLIETLTDEPPVKRVYDIREKAAGLKSSKFSKSIEPPLQHKRLVHSGSDDNAGGKKIPIAKKHESDGHVTENPTKTEKNRALEFKAGLRPESSLEKTKYPLSEYKRQYEWKKSTNDDSPLLNAEKIVFDSHTNIPRLVRDKIPRKTEYQSKFRADKVRRPSRKGGTEVDRRKEKRKGNYSDGYPTSSRTFQNPDVPFFPHGSSRVHHSEYQANFGSPKKYKYQEGIWLGAKPPHLLPDDESAQESTEVFTNWFEEVLELRAKARHYKIRALQGNYFSREYLAKLDTELEQTFGEHHESDVTDGKVELEDHEAGKHSNSVTASRVLPTKHAWESDASSSVDDVDDDGRHIYRDLNKQFENASSDDRTLSRSDEERLGDGRSVQSEDTRGRKYEEREKLSPDKTFTNQRQSPLRQTIKGSPQTSKKSSPWLQENTSGSDASSERSEVQSEASCSKSNTDSLNGHLRTYNPFRKGTQSDVDRFNVETVQGIRSNDVEVISSSVQSNYGSDSDRLRKSENNRSDCMSVSSFSSRESLAFETLSRAKQRNAKFWKK